MRVKKGRDMYMRKWWRYGSKIYGLGCSERRKTGKITDEGGRDGGRKKGVKNYGKDGCEEKLNGWESKESLN